MSTLISYLKEDLGRFDFRVPDGFGHFVYPDWDDPDLKVELYDADDSLKLVATVSSDPALEQGDDFDPDDNPEGGPFVAVEGIDLSDFALGTAEARVYARVEGVQVLPYPTILAAFEVVADGAAGPLYTTVSRVRQQAPGAWPDEVTDEMVMRAISDASRNMDAFLRCCYQTPFPDIGADPATPPQLETICRKLAAYQCLEWIGRVNAAAEENFRQRALSDLMRLVPSDGKTPMVRLPGYQGPVAAYQGKIVRQDDGADEDVLA